MATPIQWGNEFLVNTTTWDYQSAPDIIALSDGRFVAAWQDTSATGVDTSGTSIRAQIFNADSSKSGIEFQVNATTRYEQYDVQLTALAGGRFVAVWSDMSQSSDDPSSHAVRAQIFDSDGSKVGIEFLVNTTTLVDQYKPSITTLADGRFIAAWQNGAAQTETSIRAQIFTADGAQSGTEFLISAPAYADVHASSGGDVVTGAGQYRPSLAPLSDGGFVAIWEGGLIRAQIFDASGSKMGEAFSVNPSPGFQHTSISSLGNGGFVVSWADIYPSADDPSSFAARAQIFAADGTKIGAELLLNTTTAGAQYAPALAALVDGRFVAAWNDTSATGADTSGLAVRAQVFNEDGTKSGGEFLVNSTTTNDQGNPKLSALADGRFVIVWNDSSQLPDDNSGSSVRAQIFDPRESAIHLNGSTLGDDFVGTAWADTLSGGLGMDQLKGGDGDDWLSGGAQDDMLWGDAGNDTLIGGAGADTLIGGNGDDTYYLDSTSDVVIENVGGGNDTVVSAWLSLALVSFPRVENAQLSGTLDLNLTGNAGKNTLTGNAGANLILGLGGDDTISALAGNDTVNGGAGNDLIEGGAGNDTLNGGTGMDTLFGGVGKDRLIGGADADVFAFRTKAEAGNGVNRDVIVDFVVGLDKIDLSAIDANEWLEGNQAFSFIGSSAFSGAAGELRYGSAAGIVYADTNGDGFADFQLHLIGKPALAESDVVL